jgi:hypothetical protein
MFCQTVSFEIWLHRSGDPIGPRRTPRRRTRTLSGSGSFSSSTLENGTGTTLDLLGATSKLSPTGRHWHYAISQKTGDTGASNSRVTRRALVAGAFGNSTSALNSLHVSPKPLTLRCALGFCFFVHHAPRLRGIINGGVLHEAKATIRNAREP